MTGLDTNVVIRYLTQDDTQQSARANALIDGLSEDAPGFIAREVLVEIVWVLERSYKARQSEIVAAIEGLLSARELIVEASDRAGHALALYRDDVAGFADAMIALAAIEAGSSKLITFDRKAARIPGVELLD